MIQIVNWKLLSNNKEIINENVSCEIDEDKLIYNDEFGSHIIYLKDKVYERVSKDYKISIYFVKKEVKFVFNEKDNCSFDIECSYENNDNLIKLMYKIDGEEKIIIVKRKEEANENIVN